LTTSFDALGLSAPTLAGLAGLGFTDPTEVQSQAIPPLLAGRDALVQAPTGSGKTAAFVIPLAERCLALGPDKPFGLVLCPTRELATQGREVAAELVEPHGFRTALLIGGVGYQEQRMQLRRSPHIVFGSPGRVMDHIWEGRLDISAIGTIVIDEADELLDQGFAPEVTKLLSYLPRERQTVLVSATLPDWVKDVVKHELHDPVHIAIAKVDEVDGVIHHHILETTAKRRFDDLCRLIDDQNRGTVIVFGRTKHGVNKLEQQLSRAGYDTEPLQGNMSQPQRDRALDRFREGRVQVLVATNVAARGIDVRHVGLVVNYELPDSAELMTHRIGRTGRMGSTGMAVTLLIPEEEGKWLKLRRDGAPDLRRETTWTETERQQAAMPAPRGPRGGGRGGFRGRTSRPRRTAMRTA
jgi:superfamily II DNA/RNA helicase